MKIFDSIKLIKNYPLEYAFQFFLTDSRHFLEARAPREGSVHLPKGDNLLRKLGSDPLQGAKFVRRRNVDMQGEADDSLLFPRLFLLACL